ncbi:MAG: hypothetical protein KJ887_03895 [Candidatus Omnitrophica bacterium]|nr:hypothetical protein [Candidatus Omnitrophota bacterium]MBU1047463.1 hypothetical protein [Candidatus Omnitrophota bacterium]MBU1631562.1 hypothetical protein [Candidatus Omnitrophota bacterium]MBU1766873.1 hypothetical protein [Candidatus Omnitrophota bacterium]MBU1888826.1 hypothetical protein [Candidatus Omnitrophota bacterium]
MPIVSVKIAKGRPKKGDSAMKIGKIVIAGVVVTVFNAIVGMLTCGGIFSWVYKLEPINIWKPMGSSGPGAMFMIGSLILSIVLSFVYTLINKGIPGGNKFTKGIVFGLCVWAVGMLPGMFATYAFMTVSTTVVIYWTILGLIKTPLEGMIIATIYGE